MSDDWEALLEDEKDIVVKKEGETFEAEEIVNTEPVQPKPVKQEPKDESKAPKDKKKKQATTTTTNEPAKPMTDKEKEELERLVKKTNKG